MTPFFIATTVFVVFACVGYLATRLADFATRALPSYRDVPVQWEPAWWFSVMLSVATGVIGTATFTRGATAFGLVFVTVLLVALTFACYADVRVGRIPAVIMIPAIALGVLLVARGDRARLAAADLCLRGRSRFRSPPPRSMSKGRGMGSWSDVQTSRARRHWRSAGQLSAARPSSVACVVAAGVAFASRSPPSRTDRVRALPDGDDRTRAALADDDPLTHPVADAVPDLA